MASDDIRVDSVEAVHRVDNVWVHFHLAADLPEESGATIVVEAEARDGATRLVGVTLNHPQPSELFVAADDDERAVVSVGTEHVTGGLLTVAFPPDAFADLEGRPALHRARRARRRAARHRRPRDGHRPTPRRLIAPLRPHAQPALAAQRSTATPGPSSSSVPPSNPNAPNARQNCLLAHPHLAVPFAEPCHHAQVSPLEREDPGCRVRPTPPSRAPAGRPSHAARSAPGRTPAAARDRGCSELRPVQLRALERRRVLRVGHHAPGPSPSARTPRSGPRRVASPSSGSGCEVKNCHGVDAPHSSPMNSIGVNGAEQRSAPRRSRAGRGRASP